MTGLSAAHTDAGRVQRALLEHLNVHEREGTLPTSARFLFYELVQAGIVSKERPERNDGKKGRRPDQDTLDALTHLRDAGLMPWDWIVDETRQLTTWRTAPSVAEYVTEEVRHASLDRWDGRPAPLILCESRSLAGALRGIASEYACPIASTNGQRRGFLVSRIAPTLRHGQRVLYLGDFDWCGHQIEAATRHSLAEASVASLDPIDRTSVTLRGVTADDDFDCSHPWERIALTAEQVTEHELPRISKPDKRYRPVRHFETVETEAFGQAQIVAAVRARLDELMPEPLDDVLEREEQEREQVAAHLRRLRRRRNRRRRNR